MMQSRSVLYFDLDFESDLAPRSHEWLKTETPLSLILSKIIQFRLQIMKAESWGYLLIVTLNYVKLIFDQPILQNVFCKFSICTIL